MKKSNSSTDASKVKGIVTRRVFSGSKLKSLIEKEAGVSLDMCQDARGLINFDSLCEAGISLLGKERFAELKEKSVKMQFADNGLWRFLKKTFNLDVVIPGITGHYSTEALKGNLVTTVGHKHYADQAFGLATTPITAMAYGTGATAAAAGDTALGTEVSRGAATITSQTTTTTGDTGQAVKTFTAGGNQAITEEGLLTNNTSGGILVARQVFSAINMVLNDTVQFTHKIQS